MIHTAIITSLHVITTITRQSSILGINAITSKYEVIRIKQ